jgi:hypothetical protein
MSRSNQITPARACLFHVHVEVARVQGGPSWNQQGWRRPFARRGDGTARGSQSIARRRRELLSEWRQGTLDRSASCGELIRRLPGGILRAAEQPRQRPAHNRCVTSDGKLRVCVKIL